MIIKTNLTLTNNCPNNGAHYTLWAWGYNIAGQLGDGTNIQRASPVQIGTDNKWVSITVEINNSLALKSDGTVWAWGDNMFGQLGNGTNTASNSPVQIGTDNNWISITGGDMHGLGLKSDGTIWAWGYNSWGQLGDGTTSARNSPVQIGTDNNWISIVGGDHSLGLKSNGNLWAWGWNMHGSLGDGTNTDRHSPVQIGTDNNWVNIIAGYSHSIGLKSDRTQFCATGRNQYGQLGDGTTTSRNSFVCICISPAAPTASIKIICSGNTASLAAIGVGTLGWYSQITGGTYLGGGANYTTPILTASKIYYVQDSTCAASATRTAVLVTVNPLPTVTANASATTVCAGTTVALTGGGASSYAWTSGVTNGIGFIPSSTTTYAVLGIDVNGCYNTAVITISVNPLPIVTANASATTVNAGTSVTLTGGGASSYAWTGGVTDGIGFIPSSTTTYAVLGTDANNCYNTAVITINVITTAGINETVNNNQLSVYPNPNNGVFTIQSTSEGNYSIMNELGQTIQSFKLNTANTYTTNIENLSSGIYFIVGFNNNQITKQKVVVMK